MDDWNPQVEAFQNKRFNPENGGKKQDKYTLYVVGIPPELSSRALSNLFSSYGQVMHANVLPQKHDGLPRAGFVDFNSSSEAELAIRKLNGTRIGKFNLKVEHARPRSTNSNGSTGYMDLIKKLEKAPLIESDLNMLVQSVEERISKNPLHCAGGDAGILTEKVKQTTSYVESNNEDGKPIKKYCENNNYLENVQQKHCNVCGKVASKLCSSCSSVYYCSVNCQKQDWLDGHKMQCKQVKRVNDEESKEIGNDEPLIVVDDSILKSFEKQVNSNVSKVGTAVKPSIPCEENKVITQQVVENVSCDLETKSQFPDFSNIMVDSTLDLTVCDLDIANSVILCKSRNIEADKSLDCLQEQINKYYCKNEVGELEKFCVGVLCAAVFVEDNQWYRAVIEKVNSQSGKAFVRFIDYGNTQIMMRNALKMLKEEFTKLPAFCLTCLLFTPGVYSGWQPEAKAFLSEVLQKNGVCIKFTVKEIVNSYRYVGEIKSDDLTLNREFLERGFVKKRLQEAQKPEFDKPPSSSLPSQNQDVSESKPTETVELKKVLPNPSRQPKQSSGLLSPSNLMKHQVAKTAPHIKEVETPEQQFQLLISHVNNPCDFYCQIVQQSLADLSNYLQEMTDYFSTHNATDRWNIDVGTICAAQFTEDKMWYRAVVLNINEKIQVRFVDYGNTEEVSKAQVRPLPEQFQSLQIQSFHACLAHSFPIDGREWSQETINLMKKCQNHPFVAKVHEKTQDLSSVTIYIDDNLTLNDHLVQAGFASSAPPKVETPAVKILYTDKLPVVVPPLQSSKPVAINITEVSLDGHLYCQLISDDLLGVSECTTKLTKHCNNFKSLLSTPEVGKACSAYYEKDKCWYRAQITNLTEGKAEVVYLDYGNSLKVSMEQLQNLPEEFASPPAQAIKIRLADCTFPTNRCSEEMLSLIQKLMNCPLDAKFLSVKGQAEYSVKIPELLNLLICHKFVKYTF
ncbi:tudor domain-containing protein 1-like [Ciona intestinalis]